MNLKAAFYARSNLARSTTSINISDFVLEFQPHSIIGKGDSIRTKLLF
jgi:hypothetical protein